MNVTNFSKYQVGYAQGLMKDGRACIVVIAKASWSIPENGHEPQLLTSDYLDIVAADVSMGEPGASATLYENDFARFKPQCDVIMHASAYADKEQGLSQVVAGFKIGKQIEKYIRVYGSRCWSKTILSIGMGNAHPFRVQPIHYGLAFGGADLTCFDHKGEASVFVNNPVGLGYAPDTPIDKLINTPAPQLETITEPIKSPYVNYTAVSFGPISRNFHPRLLLSGTYDEHWSEHISPFLPDDFDERFYQCAPEDQQMDYVQGGEKVALINVTQDGLRKFSLPSTELFMSVRKKGVDEAQLEVNADTLIIEPDLDRFSIVWRASIPIEFYAKEIEEVIIGHPTKGWRRAQLMGKTYKANKGKRA